MRDVVRHGLPGDVLMRALAHRLRLMARRRGESAFEPTPGDARAVEEVADIASAHRDGLVLRAPVEGGIDVRDQRTAGDPRPDVLGRRTVGLAGDQVDVALERLAEARLERV